MLAEQEFCKQNPDSVELALPWVRSEIH